MESLVLLVSFIFLLVLLSGPLALLFCYLNMFWITMFFSLLSMAIGTHWCCLAPFPISIIGGITAVCGAYAFAKI
jgi:hypothetical protein